MDNESLKKEFIDAYQNSIRRDGADKLLQWLCESDFFEAPASTRFHGAYPGGLAQHSLNVYSELRRLIENSREFGGSDTDSFDSESVAIVSLLHDVCKAQFYVPEFRNVKTYDEAEVAAVKQSDPYEIKRDSQGEFFWKRVQQYRIEEDFPIGHGEKSVIIIQGFMPLRLDEIYAIRGHMGGWDTSVKGGDRFIGQIFQKSELAFYTHVADMMASYLLEKE